MYLYDTPFEQLTKFVKESLYKKKYTPKEVLDNIDDYHRIIEIAGRPVLPRGGGKAPEKEVLQRTFELMKQGAKGIVYGRNIIQHENPSGMVRALMSIVHDGATAEEAMAILHQPV